MNKKSEETTVEQNETLLKAMSEGGAYKGTPVLKSTSTTPRTSNTGEVITLDNFIY